MDGAGSWRVAGRRLMSTQAIWYAERAAGVVSYVLVTVLVVLGLALSNRVRTRRWPMFAIQDVHRFVGILAAVFIALHVSLLAVDSFMPISIGQILVPFTATYRPLATGLGTVALELLVAVAIANALQRRIPFRLWRGIHYAGFAVWGAATVHGLTAGSDRHDVWLLALYLVAVTAVLAGLAFRISASRPALGHAIGVGAVGAAVVVGILAVLPASSPPSASAASATHSKTLPPTYRGALTGQVQQQDGSQESLISIDGRVAGSKPALVRIDLLGNAFGVEKTSLQVKFPNAATCVGTVSQLGPEGFAGSCTTSAGEERSVRGTWTVSAGAVRGRLNIG